MNIREAQSLTGNIATHLGNEIVIRGTTCNLEGITVDIRRGDCLVHIHCVSLNFSFTIADHGMDADDFNDDTDDINAWINAEGRDGYCDFIFTNFKELQDWVNTL